MPIKAIKRSHCTPIGMVNREKMDHTEGWRGGGSEDEIIE